MSSIRMINGGARAPQVLAITSGKGGVGKTLTTVNLAMAARRLGKSVLIFDGDMGLANVDIVLGLKSRYTIRDVLDGHAALKDIMIKGPLGVDLIPSGSGIASLTRLSHVQKQQIIEQISQLDHHYDLILIDTGAGIADSVTHFCKAADQTLVVTTPEPHAMTDAYALIKVLAEDHGVKSLHLLVNQTRSEGEGLKILTRIADVAMRFLDVRVHSAGHVPFDPQVTKSVMLRRAATEESTHTIAGQAWGQTARRLFGGPEAARSHSDVQEFWRSLLWQQPSRAEGVS